MSFVPVTPSLLDTYASESFKVVLPWAPVDLSVTNNFNQTTVTLNGIQMLQIETVLTWREYALIPKAIAVNDINEKIFYTSNKNWHQPHLWAQSFVPASSSSEPSVSSSSRSSNETNCNNSKKNKRNGTKRRTRSPSPYPSPNSESSVTEPTYTPCE